MILSVSPEPLAFKRLLGDHVVQRPYTEEPAGVRKES